MTCNEEEAFFGTSSQKVAVELIAIGGRDKAIRAARQQLRHYVFAKHINARILLFWAGVLLRVEKSEYAKDGLAGVRARMSDARISAYTSLLKRSEPQITITQAVL
jgi:hypothetical protein